MRRTAAVATLVAILLVPAGVSAAAPAVQVTRHQPDALEYVDPVPDQVCADNVRITGKPKAEVCFTTTTATTTAYGPGDRMVASLDPLAGLAAVTCTTDARYSWCGTVSLKTNSYFGGIPWSFTTTAGWHVYQGRQLVLWDWVTCTKAGIGFTVTVNWCGAYPGRNYGYYWQDTDVGANVTVCASVGTPCYDHGHRVGMQPNYYPSKPTPCCVQRW